MTAAGTAPVTISLSCRLGRDPESRTTTGGRDMALASIAVDLSAGRDADPETWWVSLLAFGHVAAELIKHRKGDRLVVMGHLQRSRCQPRGGEDRESWTVLCDAVLGARSPRPSGGRKAPCGPVEGDRARQDPVPAGPAPLPFGDEDSQNFWESGRARA